MKNNLNIVFFGTPDFAMPVLESLIKNGYNVSHFKSKSLKDEVVFDEFKKLNPDLCIVAAYGKILPAQYLDVPKYGFINVHPSLLPKYRGPSPVQTAILNGDTETGTSIMVVDKEIDHGPLLASRKFSISNFQFSNHDELAKELFTLGAKLLIEILPKYINGKLKAIKQDHRQATFTKMFTRQDGRINWDSPAQEIYNRIRALNPEPGAWTTWKGKIMNISTCEVLRVKHSPFLENSVSYPQGQGLLTGTVKKVDKKIAVVTSMGYLVLISVQLEGRKEMNATDFVNGHSDFLNSQLE